MLSQNGFVHIIVIIVLVIIIISLLGISLKDIFSKLSANPAVNENFKFVKDWMVEIYVKYLSGPIKHSFGSLVDYLFKIFPETKKVVPISPIGQ